MQRSEDHSCNMKHQHLEAKIPQDLFNTHFNSLLTKDDWFGDSPNLNPIEDLWAVKKQALDEIKATNRLEQLKIDWKRFGTKLSQST